MSNTKLTQDEQFKRVTENGLGFIATAIEQLWVKHSQDSLKYSIINFYSGIELLLKARLMHEHWTLIVSDSDKADIDKFLNGEAQTVGLDQTIQRLKKVAKVAIPRQAFKSFDELRKHRNQMVHFYHAINVNDPNQDHQDQQQKAVILEQCRGWFYLCRLLGLVWKAKKHKFHYITFPKTTNHLHHEWRYSSSFRR